MYKIVFFSMIFFSSNIVKAEVVPNPEQQESRSGSLSGFIQKSDSNISFRAFCESKTKSNVNFVIVNNITKEQHALNAVSSVLMSGIFFFGGKYFYDKETEAINNPLTTGVHNQRNFGIAKKTSYGLSIGFAGLSGYQFGRFLAKKK